jgi:uncharacterized membrane protein
VTFGTQFVSGYHPKEQVNIVNKKSSIMTAAKDTLTGGVVFLIPAFLVFFVLAKAFNILKSLADALGSRLGIAGPAVGLLLEMAAIAVILMVCFLAGLVARRATARRLRNKVDEMLLGNVPGYAFVKGLAENMQHSQEISTSFVPVLVRFDDFWQVAFETGRLPGDIVSLYLPGAPNPWSGAAVFAVADRVKRLPVPVTDALKMIRALGRGSETVAAEIRPQGAA